MDYKTEFIKKTRKEWLQEMPKMINKLAKDYHFYFSGNIITIKKDILEIINKNYTKNRNVN